MALSVKDFSKALKIEPSVLLERMKAAGLSHSKATDEVTPSDKKALLEFLKDRKPSRSKVVQSSESGVKIQSKGSTKKTSKDTSKTFSDNIEAKRKAAAEQLKEQKKKREDQIKEAIKLKQEKQKTPKRTTDRDARKQAPKIDVKDQLSKAAKEYHRKELSDPEASSAHQFAKPEEFVKKDIEIPETITVGDLAKLMSVKGGEVVKQLMSLGVVATINDSIDQETAILVTEEIGHNGVAIELESVEEQIIKKIEYSDKPASRYPVVTVMGHVDHGKTSLLDYIRKSKVVDAEAGGITQHIGAYEVVFKESKITFIDTPGHAAFTQMRARGANTTDIVILVVAANDSVMPQTEEAIDHAKAADVSIVVAINKIDLEDADIEKVKGDLAGKELVPEDWGGNVQMIPVSATTGEGIDKLIEAISLEAELLELMAHHDGPAQGIIIESELDKFKGAVATVLVQNGTLSIGDVMVSGTSFGKIKSISSSEAQKLKEASPSSAVEVLGLDSAPSAGESFIIVSSEKEAREISEYRLNLRKDKKVLKQRDENIGNIFETMGESDKKILNVILKTDVAGTSEAINASLSKIGNEDASIKIVSSGVGGISESDVNLALATDSIILGFNVRADTSSKKLIEDNNIQLSYHSIIYELIDEAELRLTGMLEPIIKEEIVGIAEVLEVFNSPKFGQVAGCVVIEGSIFKGKPVRVLRDDVVIHQGELDSLRRVKDDVKEVQNGTECGIGIKNYKDIKPQDKIEVFDRKEESQKL